MAGAFETGGKTGIPGNHRTTQALAEKAPYNGGANEGIKTVRCESTAVDGVCQARTTTSSSLYAYPPYGVSKSNNRLWRTADGRTPRGFGLSRLIGNRRTGEIGGRDSFLSLAMALPKPEI